MTQKQSVPTLILASVSPRRNRLLQELRLPFEVIDSRVDEDLISASSPLETATVLAMRKAKAVVLSRRSGIILAADTVIDFAGNFLGKPSGAGQAFNMLRRLRGLPHQVITGLAVVDTNSGRQICAAVSTQVTMRSYSDMEIEEYISSGEPFGKAGAYAIQGQGAGLVSTFKGCHNNVVGLPLCETVALLSTFGFELRRVGDVCRLPSGEPCPRNRS